MKKAIIICLLLKLTVSHAQQQDLNLSFEKLDSTGRRPAGWQNIFLSLRLEPDAYEGNNAVKIFTWYIDKPQNIVLGNMPNKQLDENFVVFLSKKK